MRAGCKIVFALSVGLCMSHPALAADSMSRDMRYAAEIRWSTDLPATSQAEYGEEKGRYAQSTPLDKRLVTDHRLYLKELKPGVPYYYRVRSRNGAGEETTSDEYTITIASPQAGPKMQIRGVEAGNIVATGYAAGSVPPKEAAAEQEPARPAEAGRPMVAEEKAMRETLIEQNALLLPPWKFQLEPSLTYAHASANKLTVRGFSILPILVLGEISTEEVKRDIFISALTVRAGLWRGLQGECVIPYRFQYDRASDQLGDPDTTSSTSGIGDVEGSLYYQVLYEKGAMPGLVAGVTAKSDTGRSPYGRLTGLGTGHWGIKGSLTAVKSCDPVILFGGFSYAWSISREISGYGNVDPGDTVAYNLGLAVALNYQAALSFQLEQDITDSVVMGGKEVPGSVTNSAMFKAGLLYSISKYFSLNVTAGIGLTEDSPDFTVELRAPFTF